MPYIFDDDLPLSCKQKDLSSHYRYASAPPLQAILDTQSLMGATNGIYASSASPNITVAQALEIARDYHPDDTRDPQIVQILEDAISQIWGKIQAQPQSYILTREEFAVFNYFQHRFEGEEIAATARSRYWDSLNAPVITTSS